MEDTRFAVADYEVKENEVMDDRLVKVQEVAVMIDTSVQTINSWYRWKAENPDHERARLLPDYTQLPTGRHTRYWKESDVNLLWEFKVTMPQGKRGLMGSVTQKYVYSNADGKSYINKAIRLLKRNNVDADTVEFIKALLDEEFENKKAA